MYAHRQIYDNTAATIAVPRELQHRRTEVIFIAIDEPISTPMSDAQKTLHSLMGCWQGDAPVRENQGAHETRQDFD